MEGGELCYDLMRQKGCSEAIFAPIAARSILDSLHLESPKQTSHHNARPFSFLVFPFAFFFFIF